MLGIARNGQMARIRHNRALSSALLTVTALTSGGPQATDVLLDWAIPIWAAGLHASRLPEEKRSLALILQQNAFAAIEKAFAHSDDTATAAPPPSQTSAPQSPWEAGYTFIDSLKAEGEETRGELAVVRRDVHTLALRMAAIEARDARSTVGLSPQRLAHIYLLARRVRAQQGYRVADLLKGLTDHFQVEDVSDLPEKDWPAVLIWFDSLLEG